MPGKYRIRIHGIFESAHYLYDYHGPGENEVLHGHSFEAEVFIESTRLENGISVDFLPVQKKFDLLMDELDHKCLNTLEAFREINPTSENLARYIYERLKDVSGGRIAEVRVWEGPKHYASFCV